MRLVGFEFSTGGSPCDWYARNPAVFAVLVCFGNMGLASLSSCFTIISLVKGHYHKDFQNKSALGNFDSLVRHVPFEMFDHCCDMKHMYMFMIPIYFLKALLSI